MKSEHREKRALLAARQMNETLTPDELERPEQPNLHLPVVAPRTTAE